MVLDRSRVAFNERIACTISPGTSSHRSLAIRRSTAWYNATCKLGRVRLKVIPLIPAVTLHDDLEQRRGFLRLLAHGDTLDVE